MAWADGMKNTDDEIRDGVWADKTKVNSTDIGGIQTDLSNNTDGLGALKTLIDNAQISIDAILANTSILEKNGSGSISGTWATEPTSLELALDNNESTKTTTGAVDTSNTGNIIYLLFEPTYIHTLTYKVEVQNTYAGAPSSSEKFRIYISYDGTLYYELYSVTLPADLTVYNDTITVDHNIRYVRFNVNKVNNAGQAKIAVYHLGINGRLI